MVTKDGTIRKLMAVDVVVFEKFRFLGRFQFGRCFTKTKRKRIQWTRPLSLVISRCCFAVDGFQKTFSPVTPTKHAVSD